MTTTATRVDLALFHRLLDVDEDETPDVLVRASRAHGWSFPALVLSAFAHEGVALGSGSSDELNRTKTRRALYAEALAELSARVPVTVLKGPSVARHYPEGLVRPVGDLDLVVADEPTLWRAVRAVLELCPIESIGVSVFGHPEQHLVVELFWPGADPLLDKQHIVELSTAAFPGDQGPVPVRAPLPDDPITSNLLALAEERFQRAFTAKDLTDVAVLGPLVTSCADFTAAAEQWNLAPEALELLELAAAKIDLGPLGDALVPLRAAAGRERERRLAWARPEPPDDPIAAALAAGRSVGGLLLREARRDDMEQARVHRYDGGVLMETPVGDYLMVDRVEVTQEQYDRALAELDGRD
ncbi:nucleotidyltransferase family protein [Saccharothrix sp. NRRL B-16314]|uniref:nucleotidyltransferase family protein n=1 Tax=Saccharothrix sp. NRRL B-16314 TaxID=1463825 RepID=UPI000527F56C|nr:nucleotidyltransferase family protein [Saccharothrix sp. NRRL B-16314]